MLRVKHLNPRQGITTLPVVLEEQVDVCLGVKHLNPRQGITTNTYKGRPQGVEGKCETPKSPPGDYNSCQARVRLGEVLPGVKHLNPRQGITTRPLRRTLPTRASSGV